ncbi:hypothetical protein M107_4012 [Bacteroides fragilis str. 3725 D9(v)]|nr:hypothetical protein M116_3853 [Bacteroides fragilis str. 3719 A10]EXZ62089.1 hypothetical protein M107_4012 [Bacteroides fragilis str. 3725 D9(v)]
MFPVQVGILENKRPTKEQQASLWDEKRSFVFYEYQSCILFL